MDFVVVVVFTHLELIFRGGCRSHIRSRGRSLGRWPTVHVTLQLAAGQGGRAWGMPLGAPYLLWPTCPYSCQVPFPFAFGLQG